MSTGRVVTAINPRTTNWTRRNFLKGWAAFGGAAGLYGSEAIFAAGLAGPESTRIRLIATPAICAAPMYVAGELLKGEGFTQIEYVNMGYTGPSVMLASGQADLTADAVGVLLTRVAAGDPIVILAGLHLGCYELFATERVRAIRDLKGKTVPIDALGGPQHVFLAAMAAYVGLDPRKDINWAVHAPDEGMQLFVDGKADAYLGFPPQPQELRTKKVGQVVVNTAVDKPWSEYYCCFVAANREYVERHPIATRRALRAHLMAADVCASQPERAARMIFEKGYSPKYSYALETMKEVRYNAWRDYDPNNALRFHALRLHEVGMIKTDPNKLIAQATDWRFLNELKRELKA